MSVVFVVWCSINRLRFVPITRREKNDPSSDPQIRRFTVAQKRKTCLAIFSLIFSIPHACRLVLFFFKTTGWLRSVCLHFTTYPTLVMEPSSNCITLLVFYDTRMLQWCFVLRILKTRCCVKKLKTACCFIGAKNTFSHSRFASQQIGMDVVQQILFIFLERTVPRVRNLHNFKNPFSSTQHYSSYVCTCAIWYVSYNNILRALHVKYECVMRENEFFFWNIYRYYLNYWNKLCKNK